jgi:hypothetical protein
VNSVSEPTAQKMSATIATAAATGIDARSVAAWDDAFAVTSTAGCKAAALTGRALRVFLAAHDLMGPSVIRADSRSRLGEDVATCHSEPKSQRCAIRGC